MIACHKAGPRKFKTTGIFWNILIVMVMAALGLTEQALVSSYVKLYVIIQRVLTTSQMPASLSSF